MTSNPQAESVIRNIIQEICLECSTNGQTISETLAAFMVKAAVLDPEYDFNVERTLTKDDVQKLIQRCVARLMDTESPSLDTIKMQVHFDMNYSTIEEFLKEHHRVLEGRLKPVIRDITDARARSRDELDALYRKIVSYVLLRSGLGSPTDIGVVREATAALQSVFPQTELGTFMALTLLDKEKQLKELSNIITGIRLFNRDCGKGGEGIDDLPSILRDALQATSQSLETELRKTLQIAYHFTGVLLSIIDSPHPPPSSPSVPLMKECLTNSRQHQAYLKILMQDIVYCAQQLEELENNFQTRMQQLKETVQAKSAVPTAHVYPLFISLAQLWSGFQDEVVILSVLSNIITSFTPFIKNSILMSKSDDYLKLLEGVNVLTDEERKAQVCSSSENRVDPDKHRKADFVFAESMRDFDQLPLEFQGYCAYHLTANDRFLVPSIRDVGVLQHKGRYYGFSTSKAADQFVSNPDKYLSVAVESSKRSPELIQLLDMHIHFATSTPGRKGGTEGLIKAPVTKCDSGTQTDTHFMESNIVNCYEWNEWELRRKAIKLANLRQKMTQSVQTDLSHFKRDNTTQVYLPKSQTTQTKRDNSTSVPLPVTYIAGLRGQDIKPEKVDLTLSVETHDNITT